MTEKNSLVEEAIISMKNLEELVAENAKGILASTMRQEIKDLVKESLNEADDESDEEIEDETEFDSDDTEDDFEDDFEGMDDEDEGEFEDEEETIDLTNEPMSTVMKVFKKMGPEDQIEVQKDASGNIHLTDNETDNEYMIMSESEMEEYFGDMEEEDESFEDEPYSEKGLSPEEEEDLLGDLLPEEEQMYEIEMEEDMDIDYDLGMGDTTDETIYEIEMDEDYMMDEEMDEMYDSMDEEMYEDDMTMMESKKSMKPKGVGIGHGPKFDYGKIVDFPTKKMKKGDEAPYMGKGPRYEFDKKSPSLRGEFKEGKYGMNKGDKSKTHKGEEDYTGKKGMESKTHKGKDFEKMETKEASRTYGMGSKSGRGLRKGITPNRNLTFESVDHKELEILREKNEEYRKALNVFRNKLNEVAVFNSNLAYATRLFTEHSTSKQEKINILQRFDGVETIKESKNLYKTIKDELSTSKGQQVNESIERTIQKTPTTGSAINLIESKTYENPQFLRMKDLMSKLKSKINKT
jgi:hypothetical protein